MITGYDTVFITSFNIKKVVITFLNQLNTMWDDMIISVADSEFMKWKHLQLEELPLTGDILLSKDEQMCRDWDINGYFHNEGGQGPFMIMYGNCSTNILKMVTLDDPYKREDGIKFDPYEVYVSGDFKSITLVTPGSDDEFSKMVIELLKNSISLCSIEQK